MTDQKLLDELDQLRSEVKELANDNIEAIEKMNGLINDIEKKVESPSDQEHHRNLIDNLKGTISQFEAEHPRTTAILNDIMVTLSNMGI